MSYKTIENYNHCISNGITADHKDIKYKPLFCGTCVCFVVNGVLYSGKIVGLGSRLIHGQQYYIELDKLYDGYLVYAFDSDKLVLERQLELHGNH